MTYAGVCAIFVALCGGVFVAAVVRTPRRRLFALAVALTALVLIVLTVVFDTVMIRADLFRYGAHALLGPRIGSAPLEDLAWPVAAALLVPSVLVLVGGRAAARPVARESADASATGVPS